jgi:hypothetical protein
MRKQSRVIFFFVILKFDFPAAQNVVRRRRRRFHPSRQLNWKLTCEREDVGELWIFISMGILTFRITLSFLSLFLLETSSETAFLGIIINFRE